MVSNVNWNSNRDDVVSRENTPAHGPTCGCPKMLKWCDYSCMRDNGRKPAQHITIAQRGDRWNWQRVTAGSIWTSRETYATELDAAIDAIEIARIYRVAVQLPLHLRPAVADHYRRVGRMAYLRNGLFEDCRNEFERLGWTEAKLADARQTAEAAALFVERESPFAVEVPAWQAMEVYA